MDKKIKELLTMPKLLDCSLEVGMVPDAKFHYKWHEYAEWQIESLKVFGLEKEHKLLDIGCGPLRFGLEAINYLDDNGYFGIDPYPPFITLGKLIYKMSGLTKDYRVIENKKLEFGLFKTQFDFANSQSVFTHLSRSQVRTAFHNLKEVMKPGGCLFFTNIDSRFARGFLFGSRYPMLQGTGMDREFYQGICDSLGLKLEYNVLEHPTQMAHMVRF